jgi:type IV secretory pathway TraG/TraD family ATPase VirD4
MKDLYIGKDALGKKTYLTKEDLETHVHICGLSRSGKSRLIEYLLRDFITRRIPFLLIDPHGELYRSLLHWLAVVRLERPIILLDPSYQDRIVGFNPFQTPYTDEARILTKAERMVTATVKVWGLESTDTFANIERWLRNIYYVILEQGLTVSDIPLFTLWDQKAERERLLNRIRSELVRYDLQDFYNIAKHEFKRDILSTRNKLQRFTHPHMQRIMGLKTNNIDLADLVNGRQTLLVNLQAAEDDIIGRENNRTLGALLLSELWECTQKRQDAQEFSCVIDEVAHIPSIDLQHMLNECAKYGLHLFLAHQERTQLQRTGLEGPIKNAQTKITFRTEDRPKAQRQFTLRRADHIRVECETPEVKNFKVSPARIKQLTERLIKNFLTVDRVDELLRLRKPHDDHELKDEDFYR